MSALPDRTWCPCLKVQTVRDAAKELRAEVWELANGPSLDELSDIAFGVGRLAGAFTSRVFIATPGSTRHIDKIVARMDEHGCVRSPRHLINGACPSLTTSPLEALDNKL
jgi:hypothetical protein